MFPGAETLHVPTADHFDLLNHDDIYAAIRELARATAPTRPTQEESADRMSVPAPISATVEMKAAADEVWKVRLGPRAGCRSSARSCARRSCWAPGVGANIIGINRRKAVVWPTTSKVVPLGAGPRRRLEDPGERRHLDLRARADRRRHLGHRPAGAAEVHGRHLLLGPVIGGAEGHDAELAAGIRTTLERIRAAVESAAAAWRLAAESAVGEHGGVARGNVRTAV